MCSFLTETSNNAKLILDKLQSALGWFRVPIEELKQGAVQKLSEQQQ